VIRHAEGLHDRPDRRPDLFFEIDPSYRLMGPGVPALGVMLERELFNQAAMRTSPRPAGFG